MPSGVLSHYQPCLMACCLTIGHAFWCSASLSTMPVGMVPHYRPCLLAWYLTIGHVFRSNATEIKILRVECRWKKGDYKSGTTCIEVSLYQTCMMIRCRSQICLMQCNYIRHVCWVHEFIYACMFVKCCSIKQGIWSVTKPSDMPTCKMPLPQGCKICWVPSWTPS